MIEVQAGIHQGQVIQPAFYGLGMLSVGEALEVSLIGFQGLRPGRFMKAKRLQGLMRFFCIFALWIIFQIGVIRRDGWVPLIKTFS